MSVEMVSSSDESLSRSERLRKIGLVGVLDIPATRTDHIAVHLNQMLFGYINNFWVGEHAFSVER